jgi:dsDNA-specific endonuclease/ATPase MutS2
MATTVERLGIVETKVENLNEKVDEIKVDIKDMHDCLDRTRDGLATTLEEMRKESSAQHNDLAGKIGEIEKFKQKWIYTIAGGAVVLSWLTAHADTVLKIIK